MKVKSDWTSTSIVYSANVRNVSPKGVEIWNDPLRGFDHLR